MILVFGGAGYIGSHAVKHLLLSGYECVVADNLVYGHQEAVLTTNFELADLLNKDTIRSVFKKYKIDAVMHFAAYTCVGESVSNPQKYYQNNLIGTLNLLDIMLEFNVKKIVFSSTCATYGEPVYIPIDEKHPQNPINPYGKTKLMVEKILADYKEAYGLKYIALRYFNAAGAATDSSIGESHNPETHLVPLVLNAMKGKSKTVKIFGTDYPTSDGTCIRDYIHVEDLATAHRLALEKLDKYSGSLNLGTGVAVTVKEVIAAAEKITGVTCSKEYIDRRPGDSVELLADSSKATEILGWKPLFTNIEDIIKSAWDWECKRRY